MNTEALFKKGNRDGVHFHSRKRSKKGLAGFVLALLGIAVFLVLCIVSAVAKGTAGQAVGIAGLLVMVDCGVAFALSLQGIKERDVYTKLPLAGLSLSGVLFVFLFCLYVLGL